MKMYDPRFVSNMTEESTTQKRMRVLGEIAPLQAGVSFHNQLDALMADLNQIQSLSLQKAN